METLSWEVLNIHLSEGAPTILSMGGTKGVQLGYAPAESRMFVRLPVVAGESAPPTRLAEIRLDIRSVDSKPVLEVSTVAEGLFREFHRFAGLLTEDFEKPGRSALEAFDAAIDRWQELTSKKQLLSPEEQLGLWGELLFLDALFGQIKGDAIAAWTGRTRELPERHDFRLPGLDIEVKTTRMSKRNHVIHGLGQLAAGVGHDLYVLSIRLDGAGAGEGLTLGDLVERIGRGLVGNYPATRSFEEKLSAVGFDRADAANYPDRLRLADAPMLIRVDDSFPRIVSATLNSAMPAALAGRIAEVSYRVDVEGFGMAHGTAAFAAVLWRPPTGAAMSQETDSLTRVVEVALDTLRKTAPNSLVKSIRYVADLDSAALPPKPLATIVRLLKESGPNGRLLHAMTLALQAWDHESGPIWANSTPRHSEDRRRLVLDILGFGTGEQQAINLAIPRYTESDLPIVIAEGHEAWYHERKRAIRDFYWEHYKRQLSPPNGNWASHAVGVLDASIDDVIARLSDPTRKEIYPVKGLVMGYVQSGKTSHFSGLITKAADAGYRLVIVLAGTLDILRRQTQRRIDKEIIGQELLGTDEYGTDKDWGTFVSHGGRPSSTLLGAFDWERLTNWDDDYKTLSKHLTLLEFRARKQGQPFNHPDNLRSADAKIAVIKKVPARINKLCADLWNLTKLRSALAHVPTLIIDDESDQASINTIDQEKPGKKGERSSTNKAIGKLLELLPRAQYVGYTATPFANVFIDPEDAEDLFPKDFIVSLPRPVGYMGVSDFFDLDKEFGDGDFRGNKNAFVRPVEGDNAEPPNLPMALDSFVLTGAIKLFRTASDPKQYRFRHHTMLIHHSATTLVHESDRAEVAALFGGGLRYHKKEGEKALRKLFEGDFKPVSRVRAPSEPFPKSFDELRPFVAQCLTKICSDKPVRIVNGDERRRDETPDFEQTDVWAILVGGTKLSRGYTVEGLTISYYRRPTGAGDTLMQMGRWFGFRPGYRDLVRLFIGRSEPKGRVRVDLYKAFEAVCRDEEALRTDLSKYSKQGLTPRQVPPLVHQHLSTLPVTSKNKRFNAEIRSQDFAGEWTEKTSAPTASIAMQRNLHLASGLLKSTALSKCSFDFVNKEGTVRRIRAFVGTASGVSVLAFLRDYLWADGRKSVTLECNYIAREMETGRLTQWQLLLPQVTLRETNRLQLDGSPEISKISRSRVSQSRFGVYSDPGHREAACFMAGRGVLTEPSQALANRCEPTMPVMVLYFVDEEKQDARPTAVPSVGFGVQYPGEKKSRAITWTVRDQTRRDDVVI